MKTLLLFVGLSMLPAFAGGGGGLLPGNGWCGGQQQPIGTYCQSTAAVVDTAKRAARGVRPVWLEAALAVFSGVVVQEPRLEDGKAGVQSNLRGAAGN